MADIYRLGDYTLPWYQLRGRGATLVTADDTALTLDTVGVNDGSWANKRAEPALLNDIPNCVPAVAVNVPKMCGGRISTIEIIGYGTTAADQVCAWILYAYRGPYSPARRVAKGSAILGTMDTATDPVTNTALTAFYVDTWGMTNDYWGSVAEKDNADNALSVLTFDLRGYQFLYLEITPTASTAVSFGAAFSGV